MPGILLKRDKVPLFSCADWEWKCPLSLSKQLNNQWDAAKWSIVTWFRQKKSIPSYQRMKRARDWSYSVMVGSTLVTNMSFSHATKALTIVEQLIVIIYSLFYHTLEGMMHCHLKMNPNGAHCLTMAVDDVMSWCRRHARAQELCHVEVFHWCFFRF